MPAVASRIPTLSDVRAWDIEHLTAAADFWTKTATVWEDSFTELVRRMGSPGGVPWEGEAAEAAQQLAYSDKMTVIGLADQLHHAAAIARAGSAGGACVNTSPKAAGGSAPSHCSKTSSPDPNRRGAASTGRRSSGGRRTVTR